MNMEKFKSLTASVQYLVVSLGLLAAGLWAIFEFNVNRHESLNLGLSAIQIESYKNHKYLISVELSARNDGNKALELSLGDDSLAITRVDFSEAGNVTRAGKTMFIKPYGFFLPQKAAVLQNMKVQPHSDKKFTFLASLEEPGIYLVELNSHHSHEDRYHIANTYLHVRDWIQSGRREVTHDKKTEE